MLREEVKKKIPIKSLLSEGGSGGPYLLSSEPGFDLLTLVEVLQSDLPQPRQVLLRTHGEMLERITHSQRFTHNTV